MPKSVLQVAMDRDEYTAPFLHSEYSVSLHPGGRLMLLSITDVTLVCVATKHVPFEIIKSSDHEFPIILYKEKGHITHRPFVCLKLG